MPLGKSGNKGDDEGPHHNLNKQCWSYFGLTKSLSSANIQLNHRKEHADSVPREVGPEWNPSEWLIEMEELLETLKQGSISFPRLCPVEAHHFLREEGTKPCFNQDGCVEDGRFWKPQGTELFIPSKIPSNVAIAGRSR
ncbi:hypothetical protein MUK42_05300 [Musa troglodytarum]|uniref:Uncharacterized protein n=1 Tax=Musa troglodytarum TaxID=320322 RepID=A0A9E7KD58_9LILI|nr:hypothetical protein MUK42_05300 [Musa troglodytarum]